MKKHYYFPESWQRIWKSFILGKYLLHIFDQSTMEMLSFNSYINFHYSEYNLVGNLNDGIKTWGTNCFTVSWENNKTLMFYSVGQLTTF